ncbi:MAG: four helix bundle protein [Methanoregulaceae archaeon]|nr:four helix bundle protein [Methanoregulaceae archaeon]
MSDLARGFESLEVWQLARALVNRVYDLSDAWPSDERYGLTGQMRRAAISVMSNIAEGWGRHSEASLANFLDVSQGSLAEVHSLAYVARDQNLISQESFEELSEDANRLGAKIYRFIAKLRPNVVREEAAPYS